MFVEINMSSIIWKDVLSRNIKTFRYQAYKKIKIERPFNISSQLVPKVSAKYNQINRIYEFARKYFWNCNTNKKVDQNIEI